jgi:nucleoside-diphosphate-sugar epimerase
MHLVIGAGEFLGDSVSRALASEVPLIELAADADEETLTDAMRGVEIVHVCSESWSPAHRLRYRRRTPALLERVVNAARKAEVRRIVHVSTADVYGPNHFKRINEKDELKPAHAYERLKLMEETWLLENVDDIEVVVLRPARVFGQGEDWLIPRLMLGVSRGRMWLPAGGRTAQTFIAAADVGRACLAAGDRGRPGHRYLVTGFDSSWAEFLQLAAHTIDIRCTLGALPYDLAFLRGLAEEVVTATGAVVWPGLYAVDAIGKPHLYDDSQSRRELTWSPSTGSFEQDMPLLAPWLSGLVSAAKPAATQGA